MRILFFLLLLSVTVMADGFEAGPGGAVLVEGKQLRWVYEFDGPRWCEQQLEGTKEIRLGVRTDRPRSLWFQLEEQDGEAFYRVFALSHNWSEVRLSPETLTVVPEKRQDGKLDLSKVTRLKILDAHQEGATRRTTWISFEPPQKKNPGTTASARALLSGKIGLVAIPQDFKDTEKNWVRVFVHARDAKVQVLAPTPTAGFWKHAEMRPGVFTWGAFHRMFRALRNFEADFEVAVDFVPVFFHETVYTPPGLDFVSFSDPEYMKRYKALLSSFLKNFGSQTSYLLISSEGAKTYFKAHPDHLKDYCVFLKEMERHVETEAPHVMLGVSTDIENTPEVIGAMSRSVDFIGFDIMKSPRVQSPEQLEQEVLRLIRLAGGKKIAIQNAGWSTSATQESDETQQKQFVEQFFRLMQRHHGLIEYACIGGVYDQNAKIVRPTYRAMFPNMSEEWVDQLTESLATSGLFYANRTPKPAWREVREGINRYYKSRGVGKK